MTRFIPRSLPRLRRRLGRACAAAGTAVALLVALPGSVLAAPGDLDLTFSGDGKVVTSLAPTDDSQDVLLQSDGKLVTIGTVYPFEGPGDFALVRYNADGSMDTAFGDNGVATASFSEFGDVAQAGALQSDGRIVVVGSSDTPDGSRALFVVARFNSDGSLDTGFGDGGRVFTDFGAGFSSNAHGVLVQPDGTIVAVGNTGVGGLQFAVARYLPDGSPDPGFGDGGRAISDFEGGGATAYDVARQADGGIVAAGEAGFTGPSFASDFAVARFRSDGTLDAGFGGDGTVTTSFAGEDSGRGVAVQSDGRIVVAGYSGLTWALARYLPDGTPDPDFSGDGRVTTSFVNFGRAYDVTLQSDGRIIGAGDADTDFALVRYRSDGNLDTTFGGGDGKVVTDIETFFDSARAVLLQPDGKIVAAGTSGDDRAVARFLGGTETTPTANLSVTKTGPSSVSLGTQATYTVRVTNTSTDTSATNVSLTDTLSGPAVLLSATPTQGSCSLTTGRATCSLGTLAPGASATVTVVAEPTATGTLTDTATASAAQSDPVPGNNTATVSTSVNNFRGCTIVGTSGANTINGTSGSDVICALGGNDTIYAVAGNDTVYGGSGNDYLNGGSGHDTLNAGPGGDTLYGHYGDDRLDTRDGVSGNDRADGGPGSDTCTTDSGDTRVSCG
ncbi:calcium-binding protein [Streptomyces coeruleoprunus]|uniref:Calcium-binding protein n=1 Tax=Streptomyces coeruleoprunus TaxID=285563 RepID=A0ABV9X7K4_9ACTN